MPGSKMHEVFFFFAQQHGKMYLGETITLPKHSYKFTFILASRNTEKVVFSDCVLYN